MANQVANYTHKEFFNAPNIQKSFDDVWKGAGTQFATSILSVIQGNSSLKSASSKSIMAAAMKAAVLNLPIEPSLGRAYIVPYKGQAQFQLGYKGLIELAQRSGRYRSINAGPVYKSQFKHYDPFFELLEVDFSQPKDEIHGYFASFELLNGFRKIVYWSREEVESHGRRFSKSYGNGPWQTDFDAMARKTVLKHILSIYGPLSVEMQQAIKDDNEDSTVSQAAAKDITPTDLSENISDIMGLSEVLEAPMSDENEKVDNLPTDPEKSENEAPVKSEEGSSQPAVENLELAEEMSLFEGHTTQVKEYDE